MGPFSLETSVDAPRERVYAVISDLSMRPSFTDHFQEEFRLARLEPSGEGAAARFRVSPRGEGTVWVETSIARAEAPRLVGEHGRSGRLGRVGLFTSWEILEGRGVTDVRLTFWSEPANAFDRAREMLGAGGWYKRQWGKALRRLAEVAEGDAEPVRLDVAGGDRAWTGVF